MTAPLIIQNIEQQAASLHDVLEFQRDEGANSLRSVAERIRSRRRILVTGMGASLFAAYPLVYFLRAEGFDATIHEAGELLHFPPTGIADAAIIMASRSGASIEMERLAALFAPYGLLIAVTNVPDSPLARAASTTLLLNSRADEYVAIQTYTGTLLALHMLGCAVVGALDEEIAGFDRYIEQFGVLVQQSLDAIESWDSFFNLQSPIHLLARGPSIASAYAGALLFNEVAKHPSCAMPVASFRHGPVEVVDPTFRGLIFSGVEKIRAMNESLAADLQSFGANIRIIGTSSDLGSGVGSIPWPNVPASLLPMFEIVPVQIAAVRLAQLLGRTLGVFRYAPQVATDETHFQKP